MFNILLLAMLLAIPAAPTKPMAPPPPMELTTLPRRPTIQTFEVQQEVFEVCVTQRVVTLKNSSGTIITALALPGEMAIPVVAMGPLGADLFAGIDGIAVIYNFTMYQGDKAFNVKALKDGEGTVVLVVFNSENTIVLLVENPIRWEVAENIP